MIPLRSKASDEQRGDFHACVHGAGVSWRGGPQRRSGRHRQASLALGLPGICSKQIGCKVAVHHGWDDPWAPPEDVVALAAELTGASADWQLQAFGHTLHGFMALWANSPELGIQYNARSAERAWSGLQGFLHECLVRKFI
jgi:dienelactone hydrolase